MCSSLYIDGKDFPRVKKECAKGVELCSNFKFELLIPEAEKLKLEFESIMLKAEAKMKRVSCLDLREQQEMEKKLNNPAEVKTLAQKQSMSIGAATTTFFVTSAAAYCVFLAYQKMNK